MAELSDRKVKLVFRCANCDQTIEVTYEEDVFLLCEAQLAAETRQLYCLECLYGDER